MFYLYNKLYQIFHCVVNLGVLETIEIDLGGGKVGMPE